MIKRQLRSKKLINFENFEDVNSIRNEEFNIDDEKKRSGYTYDANKIVEELSEILYCESIDSFRVSYFVKFLVHDNEPNYVWYDTWDAYKNGNSSDSQNALITIKNRFFIIISHIITSSKYNMSIFISPCFYY